MDLEFPGNIHIKTLCSKFQQSFPKFHAAVKKELSLPTVHYHIQTYGQNSTFKKAENHRK